jgi:hypothetical protein
VKLGEGMEDVLRRKKQLYQNLKTYIANNKEKVELYEN